MQPPRQSLQHKLTQLTLGAVGLALLVTVGMVALYEITTFRPRALKNVKAQADLMAEITVPALEFDDAQTAEKLLSILRHEELIQMAGIYRADGSLLAEFHRTGVVGVLPADSPERQDRIVGRYVQVSVKVRSEGQIIGRVWLQGAFPSWRERAGQYGLLLLLVATAVVVLSLSIALATRRQITNPIRLLAEAVRGIGAGQDLTMKIPSSDPGEAGELARSFNELLARIGQRDRELLARESRLVRHNAGLAQLTRTDLNAETDYTRALQYITELAADIQEVERVSIWFLEESGAEIRCADQFLRSPRTHHANGVLLRSAFPAFFRLLEEGGVQEIHDARTDVRAREFAGEYLDQHGVGAVLDVPIHWRGRVVGVLCHEHVGKSRNWHADETALATAFAERVAHLMERLSTLRADAALRESNERFREFISQAQDAIFTLSLDGKIHSANEAVRRITGWELGTWTGQRFQQLLVAEDVPLAEQRFAEVIAGGAPPSFELRVRTRDGGLVTLEFAVSPQREEGRVVGVLGIGRDVTERKQAAETRARLEEQLRHSQKIEAIGTMAGGIAHDFNNILTAIIGNAQLVEMDLDKSHPVYDSVLQVLVASHRAKELVQQILAFSRRQDQRLVAVQLGQVVDESLKLLRSVIASTVRIESRLPAGLAPVMGDPTQLQQVVVNLATNAAHAMEEHGGTLEIQLEELEVDLQMATLKPELKPGRFIRLSVTDTGVGMTPVILAKIFDPFFTTKTKGKGTGLGLAVVHGIVQQHAGMITVYSAPGEGTTFQVYLPVAKVEAPVLVVAEPGADVRGSGEVVLIVDDEGAVINVASAVLKRAGYQPVGFQDPQLALAAVRERPEQWQLVITDQLMPVMKGSRLAAEIWKIRPGLPIILATGFAGNVDEDAIVRAGITGFLHKPFTRQSLLAAVARALSAVPDKR